MRHIPFFSDSEGTNNMKSICQRLQIFTKQQSKQDFFCEKATTKKRNELDIILECKDTYRSECPTDRLYSKTQSSVASRCNSSVVVIPADSSRVSLMFLCFYTFYFGRFLFYASKNFLSNQSNVCRSTLMSHQHPREEKI